jgi:hypothetical protein
MKNHWLSLSLGLLVATAGAMAAEPPPPASTNVPCSDIFLQRTRYDLRVIDSAKELWAMYKVKGTNAVPTWDDLAEYIHKGRIPPPCVGRYVINRIGAEPELVVSKRDLEVFFDKCRQDRTAEAKTNDCRTSP